MVQMKFSETNTTTAKYYTISILWSPLNLYKKIYSISIHMHNGTLMTQFLDFPNSHHIIVRLNSLGDKGLFAVIQARRFAIKSSR